nr:immunoglobulin heavy chain junction region [Mus musculus]
TVQEGKITTVVETLTT